MKAFTLEAGDPRPINDASPERMFELHHNGYRAARIQIDADVGDFAELARLLAAAPALLKALRDCLDDLERYARRSGPGPDRRLEAARAAIALAEGGDS